MQLLDKNYLIANISSNECKLEILKKVTSTNEYLQKLPTNTTPRFCLAEQQTAGKGRLGSNWHSPFGQNIYLSCSQLWQKNLNELYGLSIITALAIVNAIKNYIPNNNLKIKWPNDIMDADKKLAGILIDAKSETDNCTKTVIGIGLNVNMLHDEQHQISQAWTSIAKILGASVNRNQIVVSIINSLLNYLRQFAITGLNSFMTEWQQRDYLANHTITLKTGHKQITGKANGINLKGELLLRLSNNIIKALSAGDTTIIS